ncbi:MFS transporter [Utexia brackfieldae]|uniref:MFS transporter n=1 Tax=Utexia brackfieldae TaxID=3074108 RepID=UPI00370DCBA3
MKKIKISILSQISIVHLVSHIHMMVLPALMPLISTTTDLSFVDVGFAIAVFNVVSALVQLPVGFMVDKFGPAKVLLAGLLLGSVSFISLFFFSHYYWLVVAMAMAGLANAVYHPADYAILSRSITDKKMGRAFSVHTFSGFVGTAITPFLVLFLAKSINIETAYFVAGLIGLIAAIVILPTALKPALPAAVSVRPVVERKKALLSPTIFLLVVLFLLLSLSMTSIQYFSVSALVTGYGIVLNQANTALTAFLIACAVGVLFGGHLADKTQRHGLIAAIALIVTAILAASVATSSFCALSLIFILAIMGFLSGMIMPSRDMLVRAASPKGAEGRVFGIVSTGFNLGGIIGPLLFAWIIEGGHARGIFLSAALFMVLTAIIAVYQEWQGAKTHKIA